MKTALYRKYRPSTFDGVIGQDVVVTTLTNQIEKGAISHAYLFTGSRGTGKTSCAKIFARAINCQSPVGGSPCGQCEACKALSSPNNLDIVEMDAASNNGVDKIRDLRESVGYLPSAGKYKVYIIDEVHMLSGSAFNALLKTLEEPPSHVVFILCTTEVHKLPATILSRCMRFDFRLVSTDKLFALVKDIFAKEGIKAEDKAIMHIAKLGEGSVRDTLSVADRCRSASDNLTYDLVLDITGSGNNELAARLMDAVISSDVGGIIRQIESLVSGGKSVSMISRELNVYARDMMMLIASGDTASDLAADSLARMKALADRTDIAFLVRLVRTIGGADSEIRYSTAPRIVLESALLSLCDNVSSQRTNRAADADAAVSTANAGRAVTPQVAPQREQVSAPSDSKMSEAKSFGSAGPKGVADQKTLELLGYVRRSLRKRGDVRLFGEYAALPDGNVTLMGNKFVVYVEGDAYLIFADPESFATVQSILAEKGDYVLTVEKYEKGVSPLEQIKESLTGLEVKVTK